MAARIQGPELEALRSALAPIDTPEARESYRTGNYLRADRTKDVDKRYRWDVAYAAIGSRGICDLYDRLGVTDAHIDTALRAIVPPL